MKFYHMGRYEVQKACQFTYSKDEIIFYVSHVAKSAVKELGLI